MNVIRYWTWFLQAHTSKFMRRGERELSDKLNLS